MKLIIDIGNTLVKFAVFDQNEIIDLRQEKDISAQIVHQILQEYRKINTAFISTVRRDIQHDRELLTDKIRFIEFDNSTQLPIINRYETPQTLGKDRIAGVVGALDIFPNTNVLIIDAGTCITFDLLTGDGEYLGGSIGLGIQMRYNALHNFTSNLPLIKPEYKNEIRLVGDSTEGSIRSGVQNGVLAEVDGIINQYKDQFTNLKIIVTGGDYNYFDKYLKNNIFAAPNLVLIGLKKILDFNENK